jgi:hypothetical protein
MSAIWTFLNKPLVLLLLGFGLTTVVGGMLTTRFQERSWERQTQLALFEKRYDEGVKFLDELSDLVGRRYFLLQRYVWAIRDPQHYELDKVSEAYFSSVAEWNIKLRTMRNKTRLLLGEARAQRFLDYGDDGRSDNPASLHYIFAKVHAAVILAKDDINKIDPASREVEQLNFACSELLEDFTTEFLRRAKKIELLEIPGDNEAK